MVRVSACRSLFGPWDSGNGSQPNLHTKSRDVHYALRRASSERATQFFPMGAGHGPADHFDPRLGPLPGGFFAACGWAC